EIDVRVAADETRRGSGNHPRTGGRNAADAQWPLQHRRVVVKGLHSVGDARQYRPCVHAELPSGAGRARSPGRAARDEGDVESFLELAERGGHSRLRDIADSGRLAHRAAVDDRQEILELTQGEITHR